jgi:hypothetical protein
VRDVFGIGRGSTTEWSPRSPDFSPLGSYLWGRIKMLVYGAPVEDEDALRHRTAHASNYSGSYRRMRGGQ